MSISIRRDSVARLARELAELRKTNLTEAIEAALQEALDRERAKTPLAERLKALAEQVNAAAGPNPRPVTKEDIDEMWGQ